MDRCLRSCLLAGGCFIHCFMVTSTSRSHSNLSACTGLRKSLRMATGKTPKKAEPRSAVKSPTRGRRSENGRASSVCHSSKLLLPLCPHYRLTTPMGVQGISPSPPTKRASKALSPSPTPKRKSTKVCLSPSSSSPLSLSFFHYPLAHVRCSVTEGNCAC